MISSMTHGWSSLPKLFVCAHALWFYRLNDVAWNSRNRVSFGTLASGHDGYHDSVDRIVIWAFPKSYTANDSRIGCSELHHQGEFLHNYYTFESVHNKNDDSVVRILVNLSCELWGFFNYVTLIMGHNYFITRRVICKAIVWFVLKVTAVLIFSLKQLNMHVTFDHYWLEETTPEPCEQAKTATSPLHRTWHLMTVWVSLVVQSRQSPFSVVSLPFLFPFAFLSHSSIHVA